MSEFTDEFTLESLPLNLGVIGSGVVGTATALAFCKTDSLSIYDMSDKQERYAAEVLRTALKEEAFKDIRFCPSLNEIVHDAKSFLMVCVPTPVSKTDDPYDYEILDQLMNDLHDVITNKTTIVIRSTVDPFWLSRKSKEFDGRVWYIPEFLREATYLTDAINPPHVIIGLPNFQPTTVKMAERLLSQFKCPKYLTTLETAALVKLFRNAFLATKISFFNELGDVARKYSQNPQEVADLVALDVRIGKYGSTVGKPFGGKCLPKDIDALNRLFNCEITSATQLVNQRKLEEARRHAD